MEKAMGKAAEISSQAQNALMGAAQILAQDNLPD